MIGDVKDSAEDVVEGSIDNDMRREKVAARSSDSQKYRGEEAWLSTFQVDDVQSPLAPFHRSITLTCWTFHKQASTGEVLVDECG